MEYVIAGLGALAVFVVVVHVGHALTERRLMYERIAARLPVP